MASPVRFFFILAFALTWSIGGIGLLLGLWLPESRPLSTSSPLYYLAGYSVSLAGIGLTVRYAGREGLQRLGGRLIPWRSQPRWYVIVLSGYAVITGVALLIAARYHQTRAVIPNWSIILGGLFTALLKDPGPLGEEFGWRGFALPRLPDRYSPLHASIRLGLIHTAWHLPLFFIPGMSQAQVSFPLFTVGVVSISVFDTALYLRTDANLLLAILIHLLANVCGGLALSAQALNIFFAAEGVAAVGVILAGGLKANGPPAPNRPCEPGPQRQARKDHRVEECEI